MPGIVRYFGENREHLRPFDPLRPPAFFSPRFWEAQVKQSAPSTWATGRCASSSSDAADPERVRGYRQLHPLRARGGPLVQPRLRAGGGGAGEGVHVGGAAARHRLRLRLASPAPDPGRLHAAQPPQREPPAAAWASSSRGTRGTTSSSTAMGGPRPHQPHQPGVGAPLGPGLSARCPAGELPAAARYIALRCSAESRRPEDRARRARRRPPESRDGAPPYPTTSAPRRFLDFPREEWARAARRGARAALRGRPPGASRHQRGALARRGARRLSARWRAC